MNILYKKNEVLFSLVWIVFYVVLLSFADQVSTAIGIQKSVTFAAGVLLTIILVVWMKNNGLLAKYVVGRFFGGGYFRGLLFKAMCKDGVRSAVIVSSVTFGIGHMVNLVNGSGADLLSNILQVVSAIIIGFLFTVIFWKSGSLWACIVTHGVLNGLSAFSNQSAMTPARECVVTSVVMAVALVYAGYIINKNKV